LTEYAYFATLYQFHLKANSVIRSLLAYGMLLLFTFSITPRAYLHDLFANHQDITCSLSDGEDQLSATGFRCDMHDQVAESPFTGVISQLAVEPPMLYPTATTQHLISNLRLKAPVASGLRGPPAFL
jgi:hypothetical protein